MVDAVACQPFHPSQGFTCMRPPGHAGPHVGERHVPLPPKCAQCPDDHGGMFPMGPSKPDLWECLSHGTVAHIPGSFVRYRQQEGV